MRKIILLSLLSLFYSCTVPYDAETRLLFETKLTDSNENSLNGIEVEISVSNGNGYGSSSETISNGKTNENGEIKLIFPAPEFDRNYKISISSKYDENLGFVPFSIDNIILKDFTDYKLSIPKIYRLTSEESIPMSFSFYTSNFDKKIVGFDVIGIYSPSYSMYNDEEESSYFNSFYAKKNQNLQIVYKIKNISTGVIDTISQDLNVGEQPIETTINY
jgi:hypothetical protein